MDRYYFTLLYFTLLYFTLLYFTLLFRNSRVAMAWRFFQGGLTLALEMFYNATLQKSDLSLVGNCLVIQTHLVVVKLASLVVSDLWSRFYLP
jgi:hypothetical protein